MPFADEVGCLYCEDCQLPNLPKATTSAARVVRAYALDPDHAKALWAKSEEMVCQQL